MAITQPHHWPISSDDEYERQEIFVHVPGNSSYKLVITGTVIRGSFASLMYGAETARQTGMAVGTDRLRVGVSLDGPALHRHSPSLGHCVIGANVLGAACSLRALCLRSCFQRCLMSDDTRVWQEIDRSSAAGRALWSIYGGDPSGRAAGNTFSAFNKAKEATRPPRASAETGLKL